MQLTWRKVCDILWCGHSRTGNKSCKTLWNVHSLHCILTVRGSWIKFVSSLDMCTGQDMVWTISFRARRMVFDNFGDKHVNKFCGLQMPKYADSMLKPQVILRLPDERFLLQQRAVWKWRMGGLWDLGQTKRWSLQQHDATSNSRQQPLTNNRSYCTSTQRTHQ